MVHIGELPDSTMIGQVLAPNRRVLCASRDYLARRGTPMTPAELEFHDVAAIRENDEDTTLWRFASADGRIESVRIRPKMTSNDGEIVRSWATAGCGIIVRSEWDVAQDLHAGNLVEILGKHSLPDANIMALTTARNGRAARTTRFLGELQAAFQPIPWRGLAEPRMLG
jgi:DNA-binding transcriptional LysR family regulator